MNEIHAGQKIVIYQDNSDSPNVEFNAKVRSAINDTQRLYFEKIKKYQIDQVPGELIHFSNVLKSWLANYYSKLGIHVADHISELNIAFVDTTDRSDPINIKTNGEVISGIPCVDSESLLHGYRDRDIAVFIAMIIMVEEMYHASAPQYIAYTINPEKRTTEVWPNRSGLTYIRANKGVNSRGNWLEEGLAAHVVSMATEDILKKEFPEGYKKYKSKFPSESTAIGDTEYYHAQLNPSKELTIGVSGYSKAYKIVKNLNDSIPNFFELAENARVNGYSLRLLREIKNLFPQTDLRRLMMLSATDPMFTRKFSRLTRRY